MNKRNKWHWWNKLHSGIYFIWINLLSFSALFLEVGCARCQFDSKAVSNQRALLLVYYLAKSASRSGKIMAVRGSYRDRRCFIHCVHYELGVTRQLSLRRLLDGRFTNASFASSLVVMIIESSRWSDQRWFAHLWTLARWIPLIWCGGISLAFVARLNHAASRQAGNSNTGYPEGSVAKIQQWLLQSFTRCGNATTQILI